MRGLSAVVVVGALVWAHAPLGAQVTLMPGSLDRGEGRESATAFTVPGPTYLAAVLRDGFKRLSDARIAALCESEQSPGACQDFLKDQRDVARQEEGAKVWFPIRTGHDAELAWKSPGFGFLTSAALLFDGGEITASVDAFSDLVGVMRVSLGFIASSEAGDDDGDGDDVPPAASDGEQDAAINRLLQGGGTVNVRLDYPVLISDHLGIAWRGVFAASAGLDLPSQNGAPDLGDGVGGTARISLGASRVGDILGLETALDVAYTRFNKAMAGRIGAAEETRDGTVALFRVGVVVAKQTRLGYMFRVASSSLYDDLGGRAYLQQSITL